MIYTSNTSDLVIPDNLSLPEFVFQGNEEHEDKIYIIDSASGYSLTFKQTQQLAWTFAKNLQSNYSFKKGEVVGILLPNVPLYPVFFMGVAMAGGINTTINPLNSESEINKQLVDSGSRLLITLALFQEKAEPAIQNTKTEKILVLSQTAVEEKEKVSDVMKLLQAPSDNEPLGVSINPQKDLVCLPYSSGTTGFMKGVMLTHYNLIANICQTDAIVAFTPEDVLVGFLPYFHIYGQTVIMNMSLYRKAKIVNITKFDFVEFLKIIETHRVTRAYVVPPVILGLAKQPVVEKFDLSSLKEVLSGAAPLSASLTDAAQQRLKCPVLQGYGMTELSPVVTITRVMSKSGSSGTLLPNVQLKVVSTEDRTRVLGPNEEGELTFKGPNVMLGYLGNPQATEETIIDGWLRTGDIGYVDKDGFLYVVDRLKELIKYKGYQVPPAELEGLLLKHEGISDAAVIGVPDEESGELPKAYVVKKSGHESLTEDEVLEYVAKNVSAVKKIRIVEFVNEIPKSASGKILRRVLKASLVK